MGVDGGRVGVNERWMERKLKKGEVKGKVANILELEINLVSIT